MFKYLKNINVGKLKYLLKIEIMKPSRLKKVYTFLKILKKIYTLELKLIVRKKYQIQKLMVFL